MAVRSIGLGVLDRLDVLIEKHGLHAGGGGEPVDVGPLVGTYFAGYRELPDEVEALVVRWKEEGHGFVRIAYHVGLREETATARKRHAEAHEYAHVICRHRGTEFLMRRGVPPEMRAAEPFEAHLDRCREGECDMVAAYLLVPREALWEHRGMETSYIARVLDVPVRLMELRWVIWRKWGR